MTTPAAGPSLLRSPPCYPSERPRTGWAPGALLLLPGTGAYSATATTRDGGREAPHPSLRRSASPYLAPTRSLVGKTTSAHHTFKMGFRSPSKPAHSLWLTVWLLTREGDRRAPETFCIELGRGWHLMEEITPCTLDPIFQILGRGSLRSRKHKRQTAHTMHLSFGIL